MTKPRTAGAKAMEEPRGAAARRLGPRPLPLHLATAVTTWMSSRAALPLSRSGSLPWKAELAAKAETLRENLASTELEDLEQAVDREIERRLGAFLAGIESYRRHPYVREVSQPETLWREGTTALLDFGAPAGSALSMPILVVPSLINRAYVLDLTEKISLMRWLAARGFRPFLVDWDSPGPIERGFGMTDYIAGRLEAALDVVLAETGIQPLLMGYCMGGLLALGLALRRQDDISGAVFLATPWDFHAESPDQSKLLAAALTPLAPLMELIGEMPVDAIQSLFAALDPQLAVRKFLAFASLPPDSPKATAFVALEDWLNDGIPMSAPVARECLAQWYGANATHRGEWRIAGQVVDPRALKRPSLCVIPAEDRIVPPASALALADALPCCDRLSPAAGHIGMVVSARAPRRVWQPLLTWLKDHSPAIT